MKSLLILLNLCEIAGFIFLIIFILDVLNYFSKEKSNDFKWNNLFTNKYTLTLVICIITIGGYHFIMQTFYRNTQIGSIYEKSEYSEKYYVYLSYSKDSVKLYKLPADITSCLEEYVDSSDNLAHTRQYYISNVYWPNGNILDFDYQEITPNKKSHFCDREGNNYYIELTTEKYSKE